MTTTRGAGIMVMTIVLLAGMGPQAERLHAQPTGARNLVRIHRVSTSTESTPDFTVRGAQRRITPRDWHQIVTEYEVAPDWIDELEFRVYVLLQHGREERTLLSGTVTYINVSRTRPGRRHQSVVYLHPSTVERYGDVAHVAVLVWHDGGLQDVSMRPESRVAWWEQFSAIEGQVLDRMQTPFAVLDFDSEQALKPMGMR